MIMKSLSLSLRFNFFKLVFERAVKIHKIKKKKNIKKCSENVKMKITEWLYRLFNMDKFVRPFQES